MVWRKLELYRAAPPDFQPLAWSVTGGRPDESTAPAWPDPDSNEFLSERRTLCAGSVLDAAEAPEDGDHVFELCGVGWVEMPSWAYTPLPDVGTYSRRSVN